MTQLQVVDPKITQHISSILKRLTQISLEITNSQEDILGLARTILFHAVELVNGKGGRLCLLDETGTEVQRAVRINFPEDPMKIRREATIGVFGHVVKTKKPFAMSDYQNWPKRRKSFDKYQFTAVAGVPIISRDRLWGVILIHDDAEGRVFDQNELDLLTNLGNMAAIALSNASRLDDLNRLMESAFAAVIAVDNQGQITHFNRHAEQMLQYTKEEIIGFPIMSLYYYGIDARRIQRLMLENSQGRVEEYTTYLKSKKEQKIPIKLSASLMFDYEGKRSGSVGFFQDQRRDRASMALARLLDLKEIFQSIVNQAWEITGASHSAHLALNVDNKLQVTVTRPPEALSEKQRNAIDIKQTDRIGISGRAFKIGKSQLVGDVTADPDYIEYDPHTCSELAVPIKTQTEIIGVVDVQHPDIDAFNQTDQKNLETLAQFAAIAIHNAQLYDESQIDKRRFEAIADIIRGAAQSVAINDLLRSTCKLLEERIFHVKEAVVSIRLYDREANLLRFESEWHESFHQQIDHKNGKDLTMQSLSEGICGLVARTRRSRNIGDVDKSKDTTNFFRLISTTKSEMAVPIHLDKTDKLIGVLDVQSPILDAFAQNDLEFLEVLARQLAVDIEQADLVESAEKNIGEKVALRRAIEAATQSSELRKAIDKIIQQVWQIARNQGKQVNSVVLRQVRNGKSVLVAAYPPEIESKLERNLREIDILKGVQGVIGISGRAVLSKEIQLINDAPSHLDYRELHQTTQSELAIPIRFNNEIIAVMDIECAEKNAFNEEDRHTFKDLADHAGIAVHGSYQYDALERRSRHLKAVHDASRLISRGIKSNQRDLLYSIVKEAVERIIPVSGKKASIGVIQLYDKEKNELRRESIYPREAVEHWEEKLGVKRSLERTGDHQIGINGRAVVEHQSQLVHDVSKDPDYRGFNPTTRSELDVLLLDEEKNILGVLGLESDELSAFDEEDKQALLNLAYLAVIAIQNAQQYQELKNTNQKLEETRGTLAARTAVAWLAAERATWRHNIVGHIAALENYIKLLERDLEFNAPKEKFQERFTNMRSVIDKTREQKIAEPLSPHEGTERVHVDDFLTQWLERVYWDPMLFEGGAYTTRLNSMKTYIQVNPGWFKLALDNIIKNALQAMANSKVKRLTVTTSIVNDTVKIVFSDTGPGIPPEIQDKMFKEIISKDRGERGEGIGQMLSRTIIETYGGKIGILETDESGTSIYIQLPCKRV